MYHGCTALFFRSFMTFWLCVLAFIPEEESNSEQGSQSDKCVNNTRDNYEVVAENAGNQIEIEETNQTPVDSANNHQNEN